MPRPLQFAALAIGLGSIAVLTAQTPQDQGPKCEEVFKDIQVFKGVPADDLIPAMEFMAASMKYQCTDCHDPKDYAAPNRNKETARRMVLMQRDINAKHFNNRVEVTCNSCHNGMEHPAGTPIPTGLNMRHQRVENGPRTEDLVKKFSDQLGAVSGALVRTGTLTKPNDQTHQLEKTAFELTQAMGGKFAAMGTDTKVQSDGAKVWYGGNPMQGEGANIFGRVGRSWRDADAFQGLTRLILAGKDKIGKTDVWVVRANRASTTSTEELWFDAKSGLLLRLVNMRRSSIGSVISLINYSNYKKVGGAMVPMKVEFVFPGDHVWLMEFKSAKVDSNLNESLFKGG